MPSGLIFDIQGYSAHEGPGFRTLVYLSGCPLRCSWCATPEGHLPHQRLLFHEERCARAATDCDLCRTACPHDAVRYPGDSPWVRFDRKGCEGCRTRECVAACPQGALSVVGRYCTPEELLAILRKDRGFWGPGGGVTFTGGEPFAQADFLLEVLHRCCEEGIHTAVETSAEVDWGLLAKALRWIDHLIVDLKHMDCERHRAETGEGNERILRNLERLVASGWEGRLAVRMPVVPGFNDDAASLQAAARFLGELGVPKVHLLPFHSFGTSRYRQLDQPYRWAYRTGPTRDDMKEAARAFEQAGVRCTLGSETAF